MPRLAVIIAGVFILVAGLYGGFRGYDFTDLDKATPELPVAAAAKAESAAAPAVQPGLDERAVRDLARAEVREIIRPKARAKPQPAAAAPTPAAASETPSSEFLPTEPAAVAAD